MLGADERIVARELEVFETLRQRVAAESPRVLDTARAVAGIDVLSGAGRNGDGVQLHQAARARRRRDCRPPTCAIPVVERLAGGTFVPNDIQLERRPRTSW